MRLWSWQLLPYLSDMQFKGQLRELVAVLHEWRDKGKTNHLLINRVMEYPEADLYGYYRKYAKEYEKRYGVKLRYEEEFKEFGKVPTEYPYRGWHDKKYLRICMANLAEKHIYGVGKSRISKDEWERLCNGYTRLTGELYFI